MLRAKYLDWCSARIAERFLRLTPDEIYELAQQASSGRGTNTRDAASASSASTPPIDATPIESFRQIVERVTEVLAAEMRLPAFAEWSKSYRGRPSHYDEELLGFWKESEK